jgi:hypothetical protein
MTFHKAPWFVILANPRALSEHRKVETADSQDGFRGDCVETFGAIVTDIAYESNRNNRKPHLARDLRSFEKFGGGDERQPVVRESFREKVDRLEVG